MNERELFLSALEIEDPEQRRHHLEERCRDDHELQVRVESLLASHESQSRFLNLPIADQLENRSEPSGRISDDQGTETCGVLEAVGGQAESAAGGTSRATQAPETDDNLTGGDLFEFLQVSSTPEAIGRLGHYDVIEVIGRGAFGTVLKAFDRKLHRVVAIKVLAPEIAATSPARKRFLREARSSAAVRHENVVAIHAVEEWPIPYLVMEYIPGQTLQQRMDEHGPLDLIDVLRLGEQIARGLAAAHSQQLIHRDVKPGNILLESNIEDRVKITDFGLARAVDDASVTQSGIIAGTPLYMAPEQAQGLKLDQRADLFSFGSVLYQMLTGRPPFRAPNTLAVLKRVTEDTPRPIREIIPEVPEWMCQIVGRLHQKEPSRRYCSAKEVAELLGHCVNELQQARVPRWTTVSGPTESDDAKDTAHSSKRSRRRMVSLAGAGLMLLAGLAAVFQILNDRIRDASTEPSKSIRSIGFDDLFPGGDRSRQRAQVPDPSRSRADGIDGSPSQVTQQNDPTVAAALEPNDVPGGDAGTQVIADTWTSLFNGRDLSGWEIHPDEIGSWRVEDGVLMADGAPGYLFTVRDDFSDFHLRCKVRINAGGDSGVIVRTGFDRPTRFGLPGFEAQISGGTTPVSGWQTGAIASSDSSRGWRLLQPSDLRIDADSWVTLEILTAGRRMETRVDGVEVAVHDDFVSGLRRGRLALQQSAAGTRVGFRDLEIRLPVRSSLADASAPSKVPDGSVQLPDTAMPPGSVTSPPSEGALEFLPGSESLDSHSGDNP